MSRDNHVPNITEGSSSTYITSTITPLLPNDLDVIQDMIDISADRLEGLRTQCATSNTLTQQEIRSLETKLVRMFSELLLAKARLSERIPASGLPHTTGNELKQWLRVVGLSHESVNICTTRLTTLEQLLNLQDCEIKQLLSQNPNFRQEEIRRLTRAMKNLHKCKAALNSDIADDTGERQELLTEQLFWDSWDRHQHHSHHRSSINHIGTMISSPHSHRMQSKQLIQDPPTTPSHQSPSHGSGYKSTSIAHVPQEDLLSKRRSASALTQTPSPPNTPFTTCLPVNYVEGFGSLNGNQTKNSQRSKICTPPPMQKNQAMLPTMQPLTPTHVKALQQSSGISDSKLQSHESQILYNSLPIGGLPPKQSYNSQNINGANNSIISRSRLHTDPSPDSYSTASSDAFVENPNPSLQLPRSPCTPIVTLGMGHTISHRFTKVFKMMSTCDLCQKQMFFGLKCKECKYRCHKDCEPNVTPSCGLPREFVDEFKKTLKDQVFLSTMVGSVANVPNTSPNLGTLCKTHSALTRLGIKNAAPTTMHYPDSSSPGSSCHSSSPSSPALFNLPQQNTHTVVSSVGGALGKSGGTVSCVVPTPSYFNKNISQFNFPDVIITSNINQAANGSTTIQTLYSSHSVCGVGEAVGKDLNKEAVKDNHEFDNADTELSAAVAELTHNSQTSSPNSITTSTWNCTGLSKLSSGTVTGINSCNSAVSNGTFYARKLSVGGVDSRRLPPFSELSDTHKSNDSDKTVSLSGSTSASTDSDRTPVRLDSTEDGDSVNWPRQNSLSLKEWDIPYGDLRLLEKIGKGRFGTVHRALWHGDVAVKLLKEDYLDDEQTLEAFKLEVANFKKTRHENLVLFMGACMNPPYLAIVTSLCKGNTLYTYIHVRGDKFTINRTTLVAQQISQGMGYLHARGINHKDLRTKNIFLENGKVIITDFGLFSSTKLLYCDIGLGVPNGWLCYLAPELMRALLPCKPCDEILPFSKAADIYSFGTVWYELLCGEFPFKVQPPESIIWMVGRGMKQTLANLQTSRDIKDILMLCWSFQTDDRPDFPKLLTLLERLPKKRLARSPSHPVQLSRSAESVF